MNKVTIEDISRETGLSRGTVSRALNDRPDISSKTKLRVLEACNKLSYVPSHAARSLATGRRYAVTVIVATLSDPYYSAFAQGAISQGETEHYALNFVEIADSATPPDVPLRRIAADRIDGAIAAVTLDEAAGRALKDTLGSLTLTCRNQVPGIDCDLFEPDYREIGRLAARFLLSGNAATAIYIDAPGDGRAERRAGFEEVLRAAGGDVADSLRSVETDEDLENVLSSHGPRVSAVAVSNDCAAISVMLALARMGRWPGHDVSVLGQGNHPLGARVRPALSTIDPCGYEVGRRAMEAVMLRLSKRRMSAPTRTLVAPRMIQRESAQIAT